MEGYLPNKDLIFFNPGVPGIIYIHPAKYYITAVQLYETQDGLAQETENPVVYMEDRRAKARRKLDTLTKSPFGRDWDQDLDVSY
jgi:hypothetical protein